MYQGEPSKQVKESYYRSIFNLSEFNHLSFHKPKKDLCCFCVSYRNGTQQEKDEKRAEYEAHIARRDRVLEVKQELKNLAIADENVVAASFDLEQVLLCPRLNVASLFYRRKLATGLRLPSGADCPPSRGNHPGYIYQYITHVHFYKIM